MRAQANARSIPIFARRRGGVVQVQTVEFLFVLDQHHPVRSQAVEASRYFLDVAATPPQLRRGDRFIRQSSMLLPAIETLMSSPAFIGQFALIAALFLALLQATIPMIGA